MKSYANMKIYPTNWETSKKSITKKWVVRYVFTDRNGIEHQCAFRGMNHLKNHAERVEETKRLVNEELYILERGYNPKTKEYDDGTGMKLVNPSTPIFKCLQYLYSWKGHSRDHSGRYVKLNETYYKIRHHSETAPETDKRYYKRRY